MAKALRVGIAGLGVVGQGLLELFAVHGAEIGARCGRSIEITAVSARDRSRTRSVDISRFAWFDDPVDLAKSDGIDVFVELIGGSEGAAKTAVEAALCSGKHVVTANKALLARHGVPLARLAEAKGLALNFEAAVAGGVPVVKTLRESLMGNQISRVFGILNGTTNYILTRMQKEGRSFAEVLRDAQEAGYAEADPTFDIGGFDTAHKLAILTSLAFGVEASFDAIYLEGIETITPADIEAADELGYRIKLLGVAQLTESGIEQRVHPTMTPKHSAVAEVEGVTNCVAIEGDFAGNVMLIGPGAGARPTASSVMSDIIDISRGVVLPPFITPVEFLKPCERAAMRAHEGGYYIRLSVYDRTGAFAAIAARMAEQCISLEAIMQKREGSELPGFAVRGMPNQPIPVMMITHRTTEAAIRLALDAIERDGHVDERPQMIRIERL
jgi:homoserine dehydrogenase